jgi:glycosyltransferase involved in cell wall biosynthesis
VVTYQPWEYGSIPAAWVEPMNRRMDEVWVPSNYVRDCFVRGGIDREKVHVVPYGINPERFRPGVKPLPLPTNKTIKFLFVGGAIPRKGIDILLDAYTGTFRRDEDVCLVIKGLGASTFYRGQAMEWRIRQLAADPTKPVIVYFETEVPAPEMPSLFQACTCLVHPYRGEGFGLPILEAMACGLPVIVPNHGASLDFCDDQVAYLVPAREVRLPDARVGDMPTVEPGWWAEVEPEALGAAMRRVFDHPNAAGALGKLAADKVRVEFTWAAAAQIAAGRVRALVRA